MGTCGDCLREDVTLNEFSHCDECAVICSECETAVEVVNEFGHCGDCVRDCDDCHEHVVSMLSLYSINDDREVCESCYENYLRRDGTEDIKVKLVEAQRETSTLLDSLYENAGLDPEKYSMDLNREVFTLIEEEVQIAENQETDP